MNKKKLYELMVIISPELAEAQATKIFDEIRTELADVTFEDIWGKRKLAYPMKNRADGVYAVWNFRMDADGVRELQEHLRLHPSVVRYLMVTIPEDYKQVTHDEMDAALDAYYDNKQKNKSKSNKAAAARRATPVAVAAPVAKKAEEAEKPALKPIAHATPAPKVEEKIVSEVAPAVPKAEVEKPVAKPVEAPKKEEKKDEKKSELDEKLDKLLFGDDLNF